MQSQNDDGVGSDEMQPAAVYALRNLKNKECSGKGSDQKVNGIVDNRVIQINNSRIQNGYGYGDDK